jgi:hypothetical protein
MLLQTTKVEYTFADDIIRNLPPESIFRCFPDTEECDINAWSVRTFTVAEKQLKRRVSTRK